MYSFSCSVLHSLLSFFKWPEEGCDVKITLNRFFFSSPVQQIFRCIVTVLKNINSWTQCLDICNGVLISDVTSEKRLSGSRKQVICQFKAKDGRVSEDKLKLLIFLDSFVAIEKHSCVQTDEVEVIHRCLKRCFVNFGRFFRRQHRFILFHLQSIVWKVLTVSSTWSFLLFDGYISRMVKCSVAVISLYCLDVFVSVCRSCCFVFSFVSLTISFINQAAVRMSNFYL